jgi:hypothetical protein
MPAEAATSPVLPGGAAGGPGPHSLPAHRLMRVTRVTHEAWSLPVTVALIVGCSMLVGMVGADALWLAALGHDVVAGGRIPAGIPFAGAPTVHWHNVTVLAELVFWALESALGDRGLVLAQTLAVGIAFGILAWDASRAGASRQGTASTFLLAALGAAPSLAIARVQLFSLALFPALLALLRRDARSRSRLIWLVAPLLALWSNLHGAVLVGLTITLVYLAVGRLRDRPVETTAVAALCLIALCGNPAGVHAFSYYGGVLSNAAAQRGEGMWGPLAPASPVDALLIATVAVLAIRTARARLAAWEVVVVLLLTGMTIHAARSGIWLLLVLVTPAAVGTRVGSRWRRRVALIAGASLAAIVLGALRGPVPNGAPRRTVAQAIELAGGSPILASDVAAEQIALAGGTVWASNPIDAFKPWVQVAYLEWMDGHRAALTAVGSRVRVVFVSRGSPEAALMQRTPGFRRVAESRGFELFERIAAAAG